ncbi:hypothetical protein DA2_2805 [Desulfovibrio sp. A2]|nr:hypothetical protein DA2_2805 [Desulfovibrio sp. A2]
MSRGYLAAMCRNVQRGSGPVVRRPGAGQASCLAGGRKCGTGMGGGLPVVGRRAPTKTGGGATKKGDGPCPREKRSYATPEESGQPPRPARPRPPPSPRPTPDGP